MKLLKLFKYVTCGLVVSCLTLPFLTNFIDLNPIHSKSNLNQKYETKAIENTTITALTDYPDHVLSGQWLDLVKDNFGDIDPVKLSEYLDLSSVPPGSTYSIIDDDANLMTGVVTFKISSSQHYDNGVLVGSPSNPFPISLRLTAQVTKYEMRNDYLPILVNKIEEQLFNSDVVNMNNFRKYVDVIAPVAGATLYRLPGFSANPTTGIAKFSVFYDKYYNELGIETSQTSEMITQKYDVVLNLRALPTVITSKDTYPDKLPAHNLVSLITDSDGFLINENVYSQYIDIEYLPVDSTLQIVNVNDRDYESGLVSFDILASKYNNVDSIPATNGLFPISLKLAPTYADTIIRLKPVGSYDDSIRVDRLIPLFVENMNDNQEGIVTNISELQKFVDIISLPPNTVLSIINVDVIPSIGRLSFKIEANQYYDNSELIPLRAYYLISDMRLQPKFEPSVITAKTPDQIAESVRVDRFLEKFLDEQTGAITDLTYLEKFVDISGDFGPGNVLSVDLASIQIVPFKGTITFNIMATNYYDVESDLQHNGAFPISLMLETVYPPTYAKPLNNYSKDLTTSEFKQAVPTEQSELRTFLAKFIDGMSTFPATATITLNYDPDLEDAATGKIVFNLQTDKYYDEKSDPVNEIKLFPISLLIRPDDVPVSETVVDLLPEAPEIKSLQQLLDEIVKDNKIDYPAFTQYFDITTVPTSADIEFIYNAEDSKNPNFIRFSVRVTEYYDETGQNIKSQKDFNFEIKLFNPLDSDSVFQWWWLLLGIAAFILLTIILYASLKQRQAIFTIALMRIKNSRRLK